MLLLFSSSVSGASYAANAVSFDGTNDYMTALSGIGNAKNGTASFWIKIPQFSFTGNRGIMSIGEWYDLFSSPVLGFGLRLFSSTASATGNVSLRVEGTLDDGAGGILTALSIISNNISRATTPWRHVYVAWDNFAGITEIFINGANQKSSGSASSDDITYSGLNPLFCANSLGLGVVGAKTNCEISEFWMDIGDYWPAATYLSAFYDAGVPKNLGLNGQLPTGGSPDFYFRGNAAGFGTNSGTAGNFTIVGALTDVTPP